jgi:exosortase/archaeosortase family protein
MNTITDNWQNYLYQNQRQIIVLALVLIVCLFVYFAGWQLIVGTSGYKIFVSNYDLFTEKLSIRWIKWFGKDIPLESGTSQFITVGSGLNLTMPTNSYKLYFIGFIMLTLVSVRQYKYLLLIIPSALLFVSLRAAAVTSIQFAFKNEIHQILLSFVDPLIYMPMLAMGLFILNNNPLIKPFYVKLRLKFNELLNVSLEMLMLLLILVTPLTRIIINYVDRGIIDQLTTLTLRISQMILGWLNYTTVILANFMYLDKYGLRFEQPCMGLGVVTIVLILVSVVKGKWLNKFIFLTGFFIAFIIMNSLRLAGLLLVIKHFYSNGLDTVFLHDTITYAMYLFAFLSFLLYYFWFQDIDFSKMKNKIAYRLRFKTKVL